MVGFKLEEADIEDCAMTKVILRPMSQAPKRDLDEEFEKKHNILLKLRNNIIDAYGTTRFSGLWFVGRHPGLAQDGFDMGWQFAAPVGCGGFPDDWFEGWIPLPDEYEVEDESIQMQKKEEETG